MQYVLDASVAVKWVLPEADSAKAIGLRDDYRKGIHQLFAPDIFKVEAAHALTRAERRKILQQGEAINRMVLLMQSRPLLRPFSSLLPRAMDISSQQRIGVYDCLYIALAEREQCKVVTADQRVLTLFPALTLSLDSLP
ncbi:MAG TPA: type II toxin-antitoxin system VapC family toxin [Pirellulales bacterium]|nr:type II toxin-antitoxin system VapC family toxin [Pirellulales bacterium]